MISLTKPLPYQYACEALSKVGRSVGYAKSLDFYHFCRDSGKRLNAKSLDHRVSKHLGVALHLGIQVPANKGKRASP